MTPIGHGSPVATLRSRGWRVTSGPWIRPIERSAERVRTLETRRSSQPRRNAARATPHRASLDDRQRARPSRHGPASLPRPPRASRWLPFPYTASWR